MVGKLVAQGKVASCISEPTDSVFGFFFSISIGDGVIVDVAGDPNPGLELDANQYLSITNSLRVETSHLTIRGILSVQGHVTVPHGSGGVDLSDTGSLVIGYGGL